MKSAQVLLDPGAAGWAPPLGCAAHGEREPRMGGGSAAAGGGDIRVRPAWLLMRGPPVGLVAVLDLSAWSGPSSAGRHFAWGQARLRGRRRSCGPPRSSELLPRSRGGGCLVGGY